MHTFKEIIIFTFMARYLPRALAFSAIFVGECWIVYCDVENIHSNAEANARALVLGLFDLGEGILDVLSWAVLSIGLVFRRIADLFPSNMAAAQSATHETLGVHRTKSIGSKPRRTDSVHGSVGQAPKPTIKREPGSAKRKRLRRFIDTCQVYLFLDDPAIVVYLAKKTPALIRHHMHSAISQTAVPEVASIRVLDARQMDLGPGVVITAATNEDASALRKWQSRWTGEFQALLSIPLFGVVVCDAIKDLVLDDQSLDSNLRKLTRDNAQSMDPDAIAYIGRLSDRGIGLAVVYFLREDTAKETIQNGLYWDIQRHSCISYNRLECASDMTLCEKIPAWTQHFPKFGQVFDDDESFTYGHAPYRSMQRLSLSDVRQLHGSPSPPLREVSVNSRHMTRSPLMNFNFVQRDGSNNWMTENQYHEMLRTGLEVN
ncbi:MAG: hypothetical protein M1833_000346 [Piccolia ochrophora]|nr:MAG: hypothetical protein M1833_000346 [Piccolia ochrophora]